MSIINEAVGLQAEPTVSKLAGKVAVVTGAGSGIGLATARRFVAEGAFVFLMGRRKAEIEQAAAEFGDSATAVTGDVTNQSDLRRLFDLVKEHRGQLDVIVANAGILPDPAPIGEVDEATFDQAFNINVKGVFFTVQRLLPLLVDGASVVLMASAVTVKGYPTYSVYSATKAAVRSLARTLASDLKARKIRVNAISPGQIETPMFTDGKSVEELQQAKDYLAALIPLGRVGSTDEVAKAALFLASDDSSYVTGAELFVDGGISQV